MTPNNKQQYAGAARRNRRRSKLNAVLYVLIYIASVVFSYFFLTKKFPNIHIGTIVIISIILGLNFLLLFHADKVNHKK